MVRCRHNTRHLGIILTIARMKDRAVATVRWSNGWRETLPIAELERAEYEPPAFNEIENLKRRMK